MCKRLVCPVFLAILLSVASAVQARPFSLGAVADIEIGNDPQIGPNASTNGTGFGARDIPDRRRVALVSYDISGLLRPGEFFSDVSFSCFSHDQDDEVNVYGVIEDLDLLDVEALTWNTAPGVMNSPTPPLNDPVVLDLADLTGVLIAFTPPSEVGVRFSTDTSQALADFLNSDTDGIITFLFAAGAENDQVILRSSEHSSGGTLLEGDIRELPVLAARPNPVYAATDVPRDAVLSWTPGAYADKHDVYFGTSFADVNAASRDNPLTVLLKQNHDANSYDPAGLLEFGRTYYWRIDEVNAPPDLMVYNGAVWSFTVEPLAYPIDGNNITATASSSQDAGTGPENTINGSGLDDDDLHSTASAAMWLSSSSGPRPEWLRYEFDRTYKLHEMWVWNCNVEFENALGFGLKDVTIEYSTNGTDWELLRDAEFKQGPGQAGYAHDTTVAFDGVVAKYVRLIANSNWRGLDQYGLSEVRFFHIPMRAREPNPASGETDVSPEVLLGWRAGRKAATHELYLGTSRQAVAEGTVSPINIPATRSETSYAPGSLALGQTYYWKINEVNEAESPRLWEGEVWNFSTIEYLVVDDFESHTDEVGNRVFQTWLDGFGYSEPEPGYGGNGTGSGMGNAQAPFMETDIVHGGSQSVPFSYDNTGAGGKARYSETERTWAVPQDWTRYGIKALTLWFYGNPDNSAEPLYVTVKDSAGVTKVVEHPDRQALLEAAWQEWNIDLAEFAAAGVNLTSVRTMYIGVGNRTAPQAGGTGILYLDDIRLYPSRCILSERSADLAKADYAPAGNPAGDCVIDYREIELMAEDWLFGTEPPTADEIRREAESADTMSAPLQIWSDRTDASGGHYIAVEPPNSSGENPPTEGVATYDFTVQGGTYKILGRVIAPTGTDDSFWFNIPTATTQTSNHPSGWIWWDIAEGTSWHWDEVNSDNDGDATVQFTMGAGTHTLYVAYREDGALLDRLLITDDLSLNQANLPPRAADISADDRVDFKDFAVLADSWLDEVLWPQP